MPDLEKTQQKRQTAYKVAIKDIISGKYVKEEGWLPNYIQTEDGLKISRVNLICYIVSEDNDANFNSIIVDDGTGKIAVRSFENQDFFQDVDIGDLVLIIGRPREFGNEKYVIAEIIKKIKDKRWIDVRKLELRQKKKFSDRGETNVKQDNNLKEEVIKTTNMEKIYNLIKELDDGDGIDTEDVIKKVNIDNAELIIKSLLEQGDIFEITPGRLKVLE
jgi:RPA family protein